MTKREKTILSNMVKALFALITQTAHLTELCKQRDFAYISKRLVEITEKIEKIRKGVK